MLPIAIHTTADDTAPNAAFRQTDAPMPHRERAKQIRAAHPDVRRLFKRDPWSALWTVLLVALQVAIGIGLAVLDTPWWAIIIAAYAFGAFVNHALFVLIHDYTHIPIGHKPKTIVAPICNLC